MNNINNEINNTNAVKNINKFCTRTSDRSSSNIDTNLFQNFNIYAKDNNKELDSQSICEICFKKGNLLCCDICKSGYHRSCLLGNDICQGKFLCDKCRNFDINERNLISEIKEKDFVKSNLSLVKKENKKEPKKVRKEIGNKKRNEPSRTRIFQNEKEGRIMEENISHININNGGDNNKQNNDGLEQVNIIDLTGGIHQKQQVNQINKNKEYLFETIEKKKPIFRQISYKKENDKTYELEKEKSNSENINQADKDKKKNIFNKILITLNEDDNVNYNDRNVEDINLNENEEKDDISKMNSSSTNRKNTKNNRKKKESSVKKSCSKAKSSEVKQGSSTELNENMTKMNNNQNYQNNSKEGNKEEKIFFSSTLHNFPENSKSKKILNITSSGAKKRNYKSNNGAELLRKEIETRLLLALNHNDPQYKRRKIKIGLNRQCDMMEFTDKVEYQINFNEETYERKELKKVWSNEDNPLTKIEMDNYIKTARLFWEHRDIHLEEDLCKDFFTECDKKLKEKNISLKLKLKILKLIKELKDIIKKGIDLNCRYDEISYKMLYLCKYKTNVALFFLYKGLNPFLEEIEEGFKHDVYFFQDEVYSFITIGDLYEPDESE